MYLSPRQGRTLVAFLEALLPDAPGRSLAEVRAGLPALANQVFEPHKFDDPVLAKGLPMLLTLLWWLPLLCFWLAWKPLPLTWLSVRDRQRVFRKLEHSRLYALRAMFLAVKVASCMLLFQDRRTWDWVGYDGRGALPLVVHPTTWEGAGAPAEPDAAPAA